MTSYSRSGRPRRGRGWASATRKARLPLLVIAAALLLAIAGIAPIVAGIFGGSRGSAESNGLGPAPSGLYAVVVQEGEVEDIVVAHEATTGEAREVARIAHLPGYGAIGAVSPDGELLAVVVADAGSIARPGASLLVINLESGLVERRATGVDPLQPPVWTPDSRAVVTARQSGDGPGVTVSLLRVPAAGGPEDQLVIFNNVLGAFPFAVGRDGSLFSVVIDSRGSTVYGGNQEVVRLSGAITRDWRLSPDGASVAFIEADTLGGLRYRQRVVSLVAGTAAAQLPEAVGQQLGVAWNPVDGRPRFGLDPVPLTGERAAGQRAGGFDLPLAFSPDGTALAVQAWDGESFADPGEMRLALLVGDRRVLLPSATRFAGWSPR